MYILLVSFENLNIVIFKEIIILNILEKKLYDVL